MSQQGPPHPSFSLGTTPLPAPVPVVPVDNNLHLSINKTVVKSVGVLFLVGMLGIGVYGKYKDWTSAPDITMPKTITGETGRQIKIEANTNASDVVFHSNDPDLMIGNRTVSGGVASTMVTTDLPGTYQVYAVGAKWGHVSEEVPTTIVVTRRKPHPHPGPTPNPDPPPNPNPDPPGPPPAPVGGTGAWIIVVKSDAGTITPAEAKILDSDALKPYMTAGKTRIYASQGDADKISAKGYDKLMISKKVTAPALIILDKVGKCVDAEALPTDEPTLLGKLKGLMAP